VVTVNGAPLLATLFTVTTTFPVVAPLGTGTAMLLAVQLVGVAAVPLNRTLLVPCVDPKLLPAMVTVAPTDPVPGDTDVMLGAAGGAVVTVNATPLLATPPTVTTTFPLVAPLGTGTTMLVADQFVGAAFVVLNVTVLVPCVAPKLAPLIVTAVPIAPLVGASDAIDGTAEALPVTLTLLNDAIAAVDAVWLVTASPTYTCAGSGTVVLLI
jgi:hypothetical protein